MSWTVRVGDCRDVLASLDATSVQTVITSPPYFGLRDYGVEGQLGLEATPDEFVAALVAVFREVRRVLRNDGTVWLNLGDSYAGYWGDRKARDEGRRSSADTNGWTNGFNMNARPSFHEAFDGSGVKPKDLLMIPAMVALALRADGWYLRSEIVWAKPNPMPESVRDRPTSAHEKVFLLSKSPRYFYDADAIREPHNEAYIQNRSAESFGGSKSEANERGDRSHAFVKNYSGTVVGNPAGRNRRNVWEVATRPYAGAHFATFPPQLVQPCVLAGSAPGDLVLDPFAGSGTVGVVCRWHGRDFVGIELNPEYADLGRRRIETDGVLGRAAKRARDVQLDQLDLL